MRAPTQSRREPTFVAVMAALFLAASLASGGCKALEAVFKPAKVAPGADPVAVNAERTIRAAFTIADNFVALDDANRDALRAQAPALHAYAEKLRETAPSTFANAWAAVRAYEAAPNAANSKTLEGQLAAVEAVAKTVRDFLNSLNAQGVVLKQPTGSSGGLPAPTGSSP